MDIAVVGAHRGVRVGLRLLVEAEPGWRVVGEAESPRGLPASSVPEPSVVLVDLDRPGQSPGRVLTRLAGRYPDAPIVAIGTADAASNARRALTAGAAAYLAKEQVDRLLIGTIQDLAAR